MSEEKPKLTGRLIVIDETQTFTSGFCKRVFVIETSEKYPQKIPIELVKDNVDMLAENNIGDMLKVHFNYRGNEYNGKYYLNLVAWRVETLERASAPAPAQPQREVKERIMHATVAAPVADDDDGDDIPF
jgi:single-strand DNA-binding protein